MKKKLQRLCTALLAFTTVLVAAGSAMAQETGAPAAADGTSRGLLALAVALGIGIAAFGGALSQSRTAAAALEGIARNPNASDKVFVPMILGLAFIESLVLFTWVLMLLLQFKL